MDTIQAFREHWCAEEEAEMTRALKRAQLVPAFSAEVGEIGWDWRLRCREEELPGNQSSNGRGRRLLEGMGENSAVAACCRALRRMKDLLWSLEQESAKGTESWLSGSPDELLRGQKILQENYLELRQSVWALEIVFEGVSSVACFRKTMVQNIDPLVNEWYWRYKGGLQAIGASNEEKNTSRHSGEQRLDTSGTLKTSLTSLSICPPQNCMSPDSGRARPSESDAASQGSTRTGSTSSKDRSTADQITTGTKRERKNISNKSPCVCCRGGHPLWQCHRFLGLSSGSRRAVVREVGICFVCLRPSHETSDCPQNPWNRCGILGCYGGHHHLLHPEVKETANGGWSQQPEETRSSVEGGPEEDDMVKKVPPKELELSRELGRLASRMDEMERARKAQTDVLKNENNNLKKELKEALDSRHELALEVRSLKSRLEFLESELMERQWESALLMQQKASPEVSLVGCLGPDPGSPREESWTIGHPVPSSGEEDTSDDELLAELEAYEMEARGNVIGEEPRGQDAWWGGIYEPLRETPLEPEPVRIMEDLIWFEKDLALVPEDVVGTLELDDQTEDELSSLLEEFTSERDWECSNEEGLVPSDCERKEEKPHPSWAELSTSETGKDGTRSPAPSPACGWRLINDDHNTERVLRRLAYIRRFINSCWRNFRPMSKELSTVEMDLARAHLDELMAQGCSQRGESSVGWKADFFH